MTFNPVKKILGRRHIVGDKYSYNNEQQKCEECGKLVDKDKIEKYWENSFNLWLLCPKCYKKYA